ncbi:MAG: tryptophan synthase subunit alpha [Halothiobacillaceae bacterium]|jgi:tryptophan synthase alpha chain|nr:tryptophan synthase subunit alpha [Halothiobacillaceae bacterium]
MSRLAHRFTELKNANRRALIPYITAGDPNPEATLHLMHALVESGADVIELGVPFSDPMADGPVIQAACERALVHGIGLRDVLGLVRRFRETDGRTPVVLMGYLNPIEVMGADAFAEAAAQAGVDGVLTVDLPPEEGSALLTALRARGLDAIFLIAPTTTAARIARVAAVSGGFLYYVSLKGVTGSASLDVDAVAEKLALIRQQTTLPVGVGFGIRDARSAAAVARVADAVVIGSAVIRLIETHASDEAAMLAAVRGLMGEIRAALDSATV